MCFICFRINQKKIKKLIKNEKLQYLTRKNLNLRKKMNQVHQMNRSKKLKKKLNEIQVQMMKKLKLKKENLKILLRLMMMNLKKRKNVKRDRLVQVQMYV